MEEEAVIILRIHKKHFETDVKVPLNITSNELIIALNAAYELGIDTNNVRTCYLKAENPMALLRGNRTLGEFGVRNGTVINITE